MLAFVWLLEFTFSSQVSFVEAIPQREGQILEEALRTREFIIQTTFYAIILLMNFDLILLSIWVFLRVLGLGMYTVLLLQLCLMSALLN